MGWKEQTAQSGSKQGQEAWAGVLAEQGMRERLQGVKRDATAWAGVLAEQGERERLQGIAARNGGLVSVAWAGILAG